MPEPKYSGFYPSANEREPIPQYNNEKLGLVAEVVGEFPPVKTAEYIAEGGEAQVFKIQGRNGPTALKVFHKQEVAGSWEDQVFALTQPIYAVATNARMADRIYNPRGILRAVNSAQEQLEALRLQDPSVYNLTRLRETYVDFRGIDHRGMLLALAELFREKGLQVPDKVQTSINQGGKLIIDKTYKGGLTGYINSITRALSRMYPQLELPKRVFPEIGEFGYIEKGDDCDPQSRFADRLAMTMEWVPSNLEKLVLEAYKRQASNGARHGDHDDLALITAMGQFLQREAPLKEIKKVKDMLKILAGYGLAFGDLKYENIGIIEDPYGYGKKEVVLLDPGTMVKKGAIQDFATEEMLPDAPVTLEGRRRDARQEWENGELRAHPWFDQVALQKMLANLMTGGLDAAVEGLKQDSINSTTRQEQIKKSRTARAMR